MTVKDKNMKKAKQDAINRAFGAWGKSDESGVDYVRKIRDEEESKLRRFERKKCTNKS